ncbi:MAG TPA: cyclopropane-fatty-acyl-phospholipid synthase family protein, partial [Mycobacteriales bacterium]|nr:cyclopropane-fatty-acyl-phospholipid synthase family protein [Mycobacteriales bacterium]
WPAIAAPKPARLRALVARRLLARGARRAGVHVVGDGLDLGPADGPVLTVRDADAFLTRLARDGKIGFGEAYMAGDWDALELVEVLTPMARDLPRLVPAKLQWLRAVYDARHPAAEDNDPGGSRRNIARHYDLSNELFALFLDASMTYSAALFNFPGESLEAAQARKIDRLLDQVGCKPGTRLLEIGTGWGELALRAGQRGATVTSVTLSVEQAELARQRIAAAHLAASVDVHVQDYREVTGRFDAIVSVEMIEAVGARWWPTYFRTLQDRLAPGGKIGLQAIVMPHDRMLASRRSWTWIHKYIFPGGQLPSVTAIDQVLAEHTDLQVSDRLCFGTAYADTLLAWRTRFLQNADAVDAAGFDETFRRMWTFYLAYCEAGFRAGYLDVTQLILTRRDGR